MARSKVPIFLPGAPVQSDEATPKDYVDLRSVPPGGLVGQALVKVTADDYDYAWANQTGTGEGGGGPHGHPESEITGLVASLASKLDDVQRGAANGVASLDAGIKVPYAELPVGTAINTIAAGDDTRLSDARTPTAHVHTIANVTGLTAALDSKEAAGTVAAHELAANPHPGYLTPAEGDAAYAALEHEHDLSHNHTGVYDPAGTAAAAVTAHTAAGDPHPGYLTPAEGNAAYDVLGAASAARTAHEATANPHPDYLTQTEGDGRYALIHGHDYDPAGTASAAVAAHAIAANPHPTYLTQAEADALYPAISHVHSYEPAGAVADHVAELDPHDQYLTETDALAEFSVLSHTHAAPDLTDYVRRTGTQTLANAFVFNGAVSVAQGTVAAHAARRDDPRFVPTGGTGGQVLAKTSNTDHDLSWMTPASITHDHDSDYDAAGAAAAAVTAHEALSNPHPTYLTQAEGDALYAAISHNHNASAINAGTLAYARLPIGTTASTVAAGDDTRMTNARTPTAHVHGAADVSSGTLAFARIPTGVTSTTVAIGDHTHAGEGGGGGGFAAGLVPATSTTPTITHGLGTRDLVVSVREVSTDLVVRVATETIGDNDLRFTFSIQPTAGQYRYTILSAAATLGTGAHSHAIAEVTGLGDSLGDKAADDHTHVIADTTSLQISLDGKSDTAHTHSGYAATGHDHDAVYSALAHTHTLAALGAAATSHVHAAADVSSGTLAFARIPTGTTSSTVSIGNHAHSQYLTGVVPVAPANLTDAATIATDASVSNHFRCTVAADRALGIPTNPTDGQRALWEFTASEAQRIVTIPTGSTDSFEATVVAPTPSVTIPLGKAGFVGAIYSFARRRWTMLGVTVTT